MSKRFLFFLGVSSLLAGCGEPPPTPELPGHTPLKIERVLLDDHLDASDMRQLFEALNDKGGLKGIAPWVRDASDAELNTIGRILDRSLYQTAQDSRGLVALLSERTQKRTFSRWKQDSRDWAKRGERSTYSDLLKAVLDSPRFVDIIERDIGFLDPQLDQPLTEIRLEFLKTLETQKECSLSEADQVVKDLSRFLATPGLKQHWAKLCDSFSNTWPVVGILHGMREVNRRHGGHAFDGMGGGLAKMIREPRFAGKAVPTQFDSLLDLFLALSGPSDGLFTSIQSTLTSNRDLVRELGSLLQPNVGIRVLNYAPIIPHTVAGLLLGDLQSASAPLTPEAWKSLASAPSTTESKDAFLALFIAARTAHQNIAGSNDDISAKDYVSFNLPVYLNSWVLAHWFEQAVLNNAEAIKNIPTDKFLEKLWDTKIDVKAFAFSLTETNTAGEQVFSATRLQELADIGLQDFTALLGKSSPDGLGEFSYSIPAFTQLPFKEAVRKTMEAIDQTRGYADGSAVLRSVITYLITPGPDGKSFLDNMESPDMLLAVHRLLASVPPATWKRFSTALFDGIGVESLNEETRKILLRFYEDKPALEKKFSRILDSVGMLKALDKADGKGLTAFEAYQELLSEVGPREWKALSEAWVFLGNSKLFSVDPGPKNTSAPRFPSAYRWITSGNPSGIFKLASQLDPSRYRALADFVSDTLRTDKGVAGSELHWDFLQEIATASPNGVATLVREFESGNVSGIRDLLTADERAWIIEFVRNGSFRELWKVLRPLLKTGGPADWTQKVRALQKDGTLRTAFQLMTLVKNERMRAIATALQGLESSGELSALLDTVETLLGGS